MPSEKPNLIMEYRERVASGALRPDPAQNLVIEKLALLANRVTRKGDQARGFASALFGWGREPVRNEGLEGLYIYGSVGRGKTMMMELFVEAVGEVAWRVHFHEFMQGVQAELTEIRKGKSKEPLDVVAENIASQCRVLCLDEMQIENIADAMIVGRLFEGIFARGVVLVTTSNRHPDELYKGGLNRQRFTPFIVEIKRACEVVSLDGAIDYREDGDKGRHYFIRNEAGFDALWREVLGEEMPFELALKGRAWRIERAKPNAAYLPFADACETPRGPQDYQALADRFPIVFLRDIPILNAEKTSAASRFVTLIDILYEAKTRLYLSSEVPLNKIHQDRDTSFVFDRTLSRLHEMDNIDWGA